MSEDIGPKRNKKRNKKEDKKEAKKETKKEAKKKQKKKQKRSRKRSKKADLLRHLNAVTGRNDYDQTRIKLFQLLPHCAIVIKVRHFAFRSFAADSCSLMQFNA